MQKVHIAAQTIDVPEGGFFAGSILKENGEIDYHVVALPGEVKKPWKDAVELAKEQGGTLPTRAELRLLAANANQHFKPNWYWSSETTEDGKYAFMQSFTSGYQYCSYLDDSCWVRAVSRISPSSL